MIHARKDYDRFQDPALQDASLLGEGCMPIAEDEPVFLLRAKDKCFTSMLYHYRNLLIQNDAQVELIVAVEKQIQRGKEWRTANGTKMPDMPKERKEIAMSDYYNVSKVRELGEKVSEIPFTKPHGKRVVAIGELFVGENAFDVTEKLTNHPDLFSATYFGFEYYTIPEEIADSIRG